MKKIMTLVLLSLILVSDCFAVNNFQQIAQITSGIDHAIIQLISMSCTIMGLGFGLSAFVKFKYHFDNPSSMPLSIPVSLVFFGLMLLLIPGLIWLTEGSVLGPRGGQMNPPSYFLTHKQVPQH